MAGKSLTQRLADLQQKKADLDTQIKQIEQEPSQRLRREKQERARIIGMAMLRLVETGDWTEDKLMEIVSPSIISGKERRFLGLEPVTSSKKGTAKRPLAKAQSKSSLKSATPPNGESSNVNATPVDDTAQETTKGRLPEAHSETDILSEFNL